MIKKTIHLVYRSTALLILLWTSMTTIAFSLDATLRRLENDDPTLTSVRFWNFGEPAGTATTRLFTAIRQNKHLEHLEISIEAGMGTEADLGIRLSNACLRNYSTRVGKGKIIKKMIVKDKQVRLLAQAIRGCASLRTITIKNALFASTHRTELGEAIRDSHNLTTVRLEIDLNGAVADLIIENPSLQVLDVSENVDLTLPENRFISFLRKVHAHPTLHSLSLQRSGEIYIYKDYIKAIELHRLHTPGYHLQTLTTGLDLQVRPAAQYIAPQEEQRQHGQEGFQGDDSGPEPDLKKRKK